MDNHFELVHIGINLGSLEEAQRTADTLSLLFNLQPRQGKKSVFAGSFFECLREPYLGKNGHIAMCTDNLIAAVAELKGKGFSFFEKSASYDETGALSNIYLDGEFGGFAIHILQKK
jgi:hypothetical protein